VLWCNSKVGEEGTRTRSSRRRTPRKQAIEELLLPSKLHLFIQSIEKF
jgi:hypothetical protein